MKLLKNVVTMLIASNLIKTTLYTHDTVKSVSDLVLLLEIDNEGPLKIKLNDQSDVLSFLSLNFLFPYSNIPVTTAYVIYIYIYNMLFRTLELAKS